MCDGIGGILRGGGTPAILFFTTVLVGVTKNQPRAP